MVSALSLLSIGIFLKFVENQTNMKSFKKSFQAVLSVIVIISTFSGITFGQTTVTIGNGTASCTYPFSTFWGCGRTQMLFTKAEITAAGGSIGTISKVGLDVISFDPIPMENFNIRMGNIGSDILTSWVTDSMSTCFNGTYAVTATGWQMISLQSPFIYHGRNLLIEICYTNTNSSNFSPVSGTDMPLQIRVYYMDNGIGCELLANDLFTVRPNLRFEEQSSLGVPVLSESDEIMVYPNPADKVLYINSDVPLASITLTDPEGKVLYRDYETSKEIKRIDTGNFPNGIYILKMISGKGLQTKKVMICH
jgi:hypothetical protein